MFPETMIKQKGLGLPAAIFVITVLAVIITAMSSIQTRSGQSLSLQANSYRAFYAAESGAQLALNLLIPPDGSAGRQCDTSPFYARTFAVTGLQNCSVSVACSSSVSGTDTFYTITSRGQCGSASDRAWREIEVMVK